MFEEMNESTVMDKLGWNRSCRNQEGMLIARFSRMERAHLEDLRRVDFSKMPPEVEAHLGTVDCSEFEEGEYLKFACELGGCL